eukprot:COSAG02_NODE_5037_length_4704_cov_2.206253_6_plen_69_part_00
MILPLTSSTQKQIAQVNSSLQPLFFSVATLHCGQGFVNWAIAVRFARSSSRIACSYLQGHNTEPKLAH